MASGATPRGDSMAGLQDRGRFLALGALVERSEGPTVTLCNFNHNNYRKEEE